MNKASALSLLSNAVLVFNTVRLAEILDRLNQTGERVEQEALRWISPLLNAHVIPNGTYHFDRPAEPPQVVPQEPLRA